MFTPRAMPVEALTAAPAAASRGGGRRLAPAHRPHDLARLELPPVEARLECRPQHALGVAQRARVDEPIVLEIGQGAPIDRAGSIGDAQLRAALGGKAVMGVGEMGAPSAARDRSSP